MGCVWSVVSALSPLRHSNPLTRRSTTRTSRAFSTTTWRTWGLSSPSATRRKGEKLRGAERGAANAAYFVILFDCNIVNASATYYYVTLIFNATFIHSFGRLITRDLIPNGRNVAVTEQNKGEYVKVRFFFEERGHVHKLVRLRIATLLSIPSLFLTTKHNLP